MKIALVACLAVAATMFLAFALVDARGFAVPACLLSVWLGVAIKEAA